MSRRSLPLRLVPLALSLGLSACAGFDHLGKEPTMSPAGASRTQIAPPAEITAPPKPIDRPATTASLWQSGPRSLFGDRRARNIGDILTVLVKIDDKAQIDNSTSRQRDASEAMGIPNLFGLEKPLVRILPGKPDPSSLVSANSDSTSNGSGTIKREETIELKVAATVTDLLPNGNMVIYASQEVRVNFELRDLQVSGVIRPEDISRQNTISYEKIAEARVVYGGRGQITDLQQPRLGQQVLDRVLPF
ncbi:MAG: flagellar basal body L-ring protein FlgH [Alphaproteobacteria bacterium]|nr:flagellar basal body L-ring protein FlgH [Alphaproteobacteria bacterium]MCB9928755.1 flagellar basal body L-ring protein FlgH [Alphaproteobacteria bacterium]